MGSLNPSPELSLDFIPKTISQFLSQISTISSLPHKIFKLDDFISRLESEMRKIDAFKRELPLCMLLINDAIVMLKEEIMVLKKSSNIEPVLEEFIPLKTNYDIQDHEFETTLKENGGGDMKNWLSSTQLRSINDQITKKRIEEQDDSNKLFRSHGRAFVPIKGYCELTMVGTTKDEDKAELPVSALSLSTPGIRNSTRGSVLLGKMSNNSKFVNSSVPNDQLNIRNGSQSLQQQGSRKQRRCWSTELHRRFVNALQQLGGSQAATPKQIRELMQVDGLTNDEVKSHLQKYRLHTRRLPSSNTSLSANQSGVVLGGGLWMSPQDPYVESSKHDVSQSGSPDGPLVIGTNGGTSTTGGDSVDDGEDAKSDNYSWKGV